MIIKNYHLETNFQNIEQHNSLLLYGPNEDLKRQFVIKIKRLNESKEILSFFEDEIIKNYNFFFEKIANKSLFANNKIIIVFEATDKIFDKIEECLLKLDKYTKLYLLSNNLDKKSKLRKLYEKVETVGIIALYEDDEKTLLEHLKKELKDFKGLTIEICRLIIDNSNLDRNIIQNEINKIKVFFKDKVIIKNQLKDLINIRKDNSFDEIKDIVLLGNKLKLNHILTSNMLQKEESIFYLNSLNSKLKKIKDLLSDTNKNEEEIINTAKPTIFWKEKPILKRQLTIWKNKNINKVINEVNNTEIIIKKNSQIYNLNIINNLLINICNEATS